MSTQNAPSPPIESGIKAGANWTILAVAAILILVVMGVMERDIWAVSLPILSGILGFLIGAAAAWSQRGETSI